MVSDIIVGHRKFRFVVTVIDYDTCLSKFGAVCFMNDSLRRKCVQDPEITEQLREKRMRARWAEAARTRYQRMSSEERRAHNNRRRMRQIAAAEGLKGPDGQPVRCILSAYRCFSSLDAIVDSWSRNNLRLLWVVVGVGKLFCVERRHRQG